MVSGIDIAEMIYVSEERDGVCVRAELGDMARLFAGVTDAGVGGVIGIAATVVMICAGRAVIIVHM